MAQGEDRSNREMEKIASFRVNHDLLTQGIYVSRKDRIGGETATTIDIRVKRPNAEPAMTPEAAHTIEHLGATYLRNLDGWKDEIVYFGPMGCLTGFYLIVAGDYEPQTPRYTKLAEAVMGMFRFVAEYEGEIPGTHPDECGNFRLHDLSAAKAVASDMLTLNSEGKLRFVYP